MSRVAVLGSNGFVGRHVVAAFAGSGTQVRAVVRAEAVEVPGGDGIEVHRLGGAGWRAALDGCSTVVHLIARTHHLSEGESPAAERSYRQVNVELTEQVAAAAAAVGIDRLVYVSSIKALGESRAGSYTEDDEPQPQDAYGRTKLEAERVVAAGAVPSVILRPPLVYGPGAGGNVARLLRALQRGVPLPLGRAGAQRSLVSVANLADAVLTASSSPAAIGRTYLVADRELLTVRMLVETLAQGLGRAPRLLPVPVGLLRAAGRAAGRGQELDRLLLPLVLDTSRIQTELGWCPPESASEALRATAVSFGRGP